MKCNYEDRLAAGVTRALIREEGSTVLTRSICYRCSGQVLLFQRTIFIPLGLHTGTKIGALTAPLGNSSAGDMECH
jgi:hypothetical protein